MLDQIAEPVSSPAVAAPGATLYDLVEKAIAELKPHLNRDGGDIKLVTIDGDMVVVDLTGNCTGCVLSSVTLAGVRKRIIDLVGRPLKVVPQSALIAAGMTFRRPERQESRQ
jgi:Fe-S cluster biogenesis protein NfuA